MSTTEELARTAANRLAAEAGVARYRDGRLEPNWLSRNLRPRWRMVRLNGQWYNRDLLRNRITDRGAQVPATRRALTNAEARNVRNTNPWSLSRYTGRHSIVVNPSILPP